MFEDFRSKVYEVYYTLVEQGADLIDEVFESVEDFIDDLKNDDD